MNILILTFWSYDDALIQAYTLPYVQIINENKSIKKIFFVTLEKEVLSKEKKEKIATVLAKQGINWFPLRYHRFGARAIVTWLGSGLLLATLIFKKNISVIHCWCTPAGAIGYFLSLLTGRKLVIDSYEPHAEAMVESKTWSKKSIAFMLLFWLEKKQSQRASNFILATAGMKPYALTKYGVVIKSYFVKPACVNSALYLNEFVKEKKLLNELSLEGKIVCVYAGKFGDLYFEEESFRFFKTAYDFWKGDFCVLLLTNQDRKTIDHYCAKVGLDSSVVISRFVAHTDVPRYLSLADFAITPMKPIPSRRYCTPIKNGEYWAAGLPVVIPNGISDDSEIIEKGNIGAVIDSLDAKNCSLAVEKINLLLQGDRAELRKKIKSVAVRYRDFSVAKKIYSDLYSA